MVDSDDQQPTGEARARRIAALVAAGDHVGAARVAADAGDLRRGVSLYERAGRFAAALPLALRLRDTALAVRLALDAGDAAAAERIAEDIPRESVPELRAAATAFASRGRHWEAARLSERAGDHALAAGHFRRAGSLID